MKLSLVTIAFLQFFSLAAQNECSFFITNNWHFAYPEMFTAQIDPGAETLTVSPLSDSFAGLTLIGVHESLDCGVDPLCYFPLQNPISETIQLPEMFFECAQNASPMFLSVCWESSENKPDREAPANH